VKTINDSRFRALRVMLALLVILALVAALRATAAVTMPVGLALFVVVLAWPVQEWLERRRIPRWVAYCLTLFCIILVLAVFLGLLYASVRNVVSKAPEYEGRFAEAYQDMRAWAEARGLGAATDAVENAGNGEEGEGASPEMIAGAARSVITYGYGLLGMLTLTITFTVLGLVEVHRFREKLRSSVRPELAKKVREAGREVGTTLQRYMVVRTIVSATTGILVGLYTWAIGLDFPLVWGVMSFLLNYIPVLGSIVSVVPPTLFALLHPEWWVFFAALGGLTVIQFTIGNFIDPRLEGRILALSPFVLFLSIVFWGWVWSIPGALMGIPITATIVIFCRKFAATQPVAALLTK
jgi:AI-2 transport protein TqsA